MKIYFKIYGERHTATKYLGKLLELNFGLISLEGGGLDLVKRFPVTFFDELYCDAYSAITYPFNLGWKHSVVKKDVFSRGVGNIRGNTVFVGLVRNPYSWLLSMCSKPYHHKRTWESLEEFLNTRWKLVLRDGVGSRYLDSPIDLWNIKNASYLDAGLHIVTYEELIRQPARQLRKIAVLHGFSYMMIDFVGYSKSLSDPAKNSRIHFDEVNSQFWRKLLKDRDISIINSRIDTSLMKRFGYETL